MGGGFVLDKELIRRRFARSILSYADQAVVQRRMAEMLTDLITLQDLRCEFSRVLEIGCGSGIMTAELLRRFGCQELFLNDLVSECEEIAPQGAEFLTGDIEGLPLPEHLDLVASNAVFQWLREPGQLFARLHEAMEPGALLAFSTFGPENCREVALAGDSGLVYRDAAAWGALVEEHFELCALHEELHALLFDDPAAVLRHLRETGVTAPGGGERWTRGKLAAFFAAYCEQFSEDDKVSLTYHPILVLARKRV